jgi:hypothetical protein
MRARSSGLWTCRAAPSPLESKPPVGSAWWRPCHAGYATPLHIHYLDDEAVYVVSGRLTFFVGGRKVGADGGSYVYQPRGVAHGFRVDREAPARILLLTVPAAADHGSPPGAEPTSLPGPYHLTVESLADLAARFNIDVLGPLPEAANE